MKKYCESLIQTKRWKTREVFVGNVGVGAHHPIRLQSMTTSSTQDIEKTVDQIIRLSDHGCDIARVTVQGKKEALACQKIKNQLIQKGYTIPLVADIHFYPPAAMLVSEYVDKIRINPGNFVDRRATFKTIEYDDCSYQAEIQRMYDVFGPLVEKCKVYGCAMRIGTNHGSLSDRVMNRYGDSSDGMVQSAIEFAQICRELDYHAFMFSMKSSNPLIMIQAYRLLVEEMISKGWNYPLHLGVTEAGMGEDGRVKSAIGIGSLLLDGLGDTIRVSLTEDPWHEIDPCRRLRSCADLYYRKPAVNYVERYRNIRVINQSRIDHSFLHHNGSVFVWGSDHTSTAADGAYNGRICRVGNDKMTVIPIEDFQGDAIVSIKDGGPLTWEPLLHYSTRCIFLEMTESFLHQSRYFFDWLRDHSLDIPVVFIGHYPIDNKDVIIRASAEIGALFADGLGHGLVFKGTPLTQEQEVRLAFNILQGSRKRMVKTEFIACPSCGRTLFDLQTTTQKIRQKTAHLPGIKIAIMGCIVNGPGEMADADFGYVGSGTDRIDLYVGKEKVEKDVYYLDAVERLIALIKTHGCWIDPKDANAIGHEGL